MLGVPPVDLVLSSPWLPDLHRCLCQRCVQRPHLVATAGVRWREARPVLRFVVTLICWPCIHGPLQCLHYYRNPKWCRLGNLLGGRIQQPLTSRQPDPAWCGEEAARRMEGHSSRYRFRRAAAAATVAEVCRLLSGRIWWRGGRGPLRGAAAATATPSDERETIGSERARERDGERERSRG
uniref:Uncharacterized protein n=1 Tax=Oryza sativa subsp. japonica TaxID=39947 RepID=Q65XU9_ORYSJ|nr:hypothetical protein [Oryza sativa Japonica Group]